MNSRLRYVSVVVASAIALICGACTPTPAPYNSGGGDTEGGTPSFPVDESTIHLNQIQLIGSHNSYHIAPAAPIMQWLDFFADAVPEIKDSLGDPALLNYTHAPLETQLDRGLRTFELDVAADPVGGLYSQPALPKLLNLPVAMPQHMDQPGIKVIHIQEIDFMSTCQPFVACLQEMKAWSDQHPDHLPIVINIELKNGNLPAPFDLTKVHPFDSQQLDELDNEIRSVLGDRLLTPDDVRGDSVDLNTAITTRGWPTLAESRGRFMFFMDNADTRSAYLEGHPSLEGRVLFTSSGEGQPDGAVLKVNDPGDGSRIRSLVQEGYIVRTRADSEVTAPSITVRDTALGSGAQLVHTDFPVGEASRESGYVVSFGTNPSARCNPVTTVPATCTQAALREND